MAIPFRHLWCGVFYTVTTGLAAALDSVVVFHEIHYHPDDGSTSAEWIELFNQMGVDIDLTGWRIEGGVDFVFPQDTVIAGRGYLVVAADPGRSGGGALGPWTGSLSNDGEELRLVTGTGRLMNRVAYDDVEPWPVAADGFGATLAKGRPMGASPDPHAWGWSVEAGGTPGQANGAVLTSGDAELLINEYGPSALGPGIELFNRTAESRDLSAFGMYRPEREDPGPFPLSGTLEPGRFHLPSEGGFDPPLEESERIALVRLADGSVLDAVRIADGIRARYPDGARECVSPEVASWGSPNLFTPETRVVINEILYHHAPDYEDPGEFGDADGIPASAAWRYQAGTGLPSGWSEAAHPEWDSGPGGFGFSLDSGILPEALRTALPRGVLTHYFEMNFEAGEGEAARIRHLIDDGAVFYLNGEEVLRYNMPDGEVGPDTAAQSRIDNAVWSDWITVAPEFLAPGTNRLSVELHQTSILSEDAVFALQLEVPRVIRLPRSYGENSEEWIELHNPGDEPVDLSGWSLTDAVDFVFPEGSLLPAGGYVVATGDAETLQSKEPDVVIYGDWSGGLANSTDLVVLRDQRGNVADRVRYFDDGRWPEAADGRGSSLELRDPRSDNASGEAWAGSDSWSQSPWVELKYRGVAERSAVGPDTQWREFVLGLVDAGEVLLDDIRVTEDPDGSPVPLIRNSSFEPSIFGGSSLREWRALGTHRHVEVIADPDNPANHVLYLRASGLTEHMHNHLETTLSGGAAIANGREYEISMRARWISGSPQLHTRLYFNRLARVHILPGPERTGTPGRRNSAVIENAGPTFASARHDPVVPAPGLPVTIEAEAADPDGIAAVRVFYSVDGAAFVSAPMGAVEGTAGLFRATLPGGPAGSQVQFYIEAEDALSAVSWFPAAGPDSRALYQTGSAPNTALPAMRILMTPDDADFLHGVIQLMSNDRIGATIIYDEETVVYDAGVRLKGSERGRVTQPRLGFNVAFPREQAFRGVHGTLAIDRSEGVGFGQREILFNQAGQRGNVVPAEYNDLVHVVAPRAQHTGPAELQMARYGSIFLDGQFENGSEGSLYEYELIYYPTSTNSEGYKLPQPDLVVGTPVTWLGPEKEAYRWNFLLKNNSRRDDFGPVMRMGRLFSLGTAEFLEQVEDVLDVDQWLRAMAFSSLTGSGDQYFANSGHNGMFYERPGDGRMLYFPHDLDFAFSETRAIDENQDLRRILADPVWRRWYLGHLDDLAEYAWAPEYLGRWASHFGDLLPGQPFNSHLAYMAARRNFVKSQITQRLPRVTFDITTNGGSNFSTDEPVAALEGAGWLNVRNIRREETGELLDVVWIDDRNWRVQIALRTGANPVTLQALDFQGTTGSIFSPTGRDSIEITYTGLVEPAASWNLTVAELMYHPADPSPEEEAMGFQNDNDFEFVELLNIGPSAVDLSGVAFTAGIDFRFDDGPVSQLEPGERVLVVSNPQAFEARYGPGLPVAGSYTDTRLSNAGEEVVLTGAGGTTIFRFRYEDDSPWPAEADGGGFSLERIAPEDGGDAALAENWRASMELGGTPGRGSEAPPAYAEWAASIFTPEQLADPAISGSEADPDEDGLINLLEYVLGGMPLAGSDSPVAMVRTSEGIDLRIRQRSGPGVPAITWEESGDLKDWEALPGDRLQEVERSSLGSGLFEISYRLDLDGDAQQYLRVRVTE
ncbi:MAG TPA: lamin tail domain-containing protein [Verrucomicrobiales bacterium]|nr:lamin tail domain-containing protein [Verrucomicrobiales bacterium]